MENEVKEPAPKYNYVSPEEYLEMERASAEKHEYYKGKVLPLFRDSSSHDDIVKSLAHNVVVKNINSLVLPFLKRKPCDMFGSELRIHIPENNFYTYPDLSIICGKPETTGEEKDTAVKPSVLIEVLSKSTKDYDRGTKFYLYRSIKTLHEYITIDSLSVSAEIYTRKEDNSWNLTEFKQLSDSFCISSVGLTLFLEDIYEDVSFDE